MRGERGGDLRVASFSLPSHPGPVERVSTSFSGSGWCGSGAVGAVGGASSLVEFIAPRCETGFFSGPQDEPGSAPQYIPAKPRG